MDNMDIRFGRKNGSYDFNKTDKGVQRSAFGNNAAADSIFKRFDKDHNNILDAQELADAKAAIKEAAEKHKSSNMGKREAANFLGEDYKGTNAQKDILEFLNIIGSSADSVESAITDDKGNTTVVYNYDDAQKSQLTENYIKDGENSVLNSKVYNNDDGSILTEIYEKDGKTLKSKTLVQGSVTTEYDPKNPDKPICKTTDKGAGLKEVVQYTYNEDGTVTETTTINGKVASHIIKDAQGNVIKSTEYTYDGDKKTTTQKEGNKEVIIVEENGKQISATQNEYNDNGKKLSQTKQIGEESYSVQYDGEGNTPVIVQNRETIDDIAEKFGCKKEDLINANKDLVKGDEKNPKFEVGQEIKIPREVEADDKALQNRKTAQEAIAEHARDEQIRIQQEAKAEAARLQREAKARAREAQCRELGLKDHKGAGEEVIAHTKTQQGLKLKKIGNASNGRSICEGQGGKLFVVAHDGGILKTSYVKGTEAYNKGEKVQGKAKDKNGKPVNVKCAVVQKNYDKHGRLVVVDEHGQYHIMAQDGTLLSNEYVQKSNRADAIKTDAKTARTETMGMLSAQLDSAQKAFDQQMKEDGWAGDVADGVSILWGSKNRASEVRKDLAQYRNTIEELKNCKTDEEFKAKFKEKFGVDYNADAIANYLMKPSAENYRKAFGTKQPIGERVAKYNESQQTGAGVVKTTAKVAGAIALTAATVATGGAAGVVAGMAVAAGSAVAADVVVDVTDRVSSEEGLKDGELTEIVKEAAVDGVIAGATFGAGKALGAGYKAYKGAKVASETARAAEKATASAATNAAEQAAAGAERGVVAAEQAAQKALAKAENTVAREAAKEAEQKAASTAEKAIVKAESQAETAVAKAEEKTAETGVVKAEEKATEAAAENSGKSAATSAELTGTEEAVADAVADTAVGAGAEYVENGEITVEGTLTNMAMGSIGLAGEKIGSKIKGKFHKSSSPDVDPTGGSHKPDGPNAPKDGPQKTEGADDVHSQKTSEQTQSATSENKTGNTEEARGTNSNNKTENAENSQNANQNRAQQHSADEDVHVMSEQEIKDEIAKLQPEYDSLKKETLIINKMETDFADFIDGNITDPAQLKKQYRELQLLTHPDRIGGDGKINQALNELKSAIDSGDRARIITAKNELKHIIREKRTNFNRIKQNIDSLNDSLNPNSAKAKDNTSQEQVHQQTNSNSEKIVDKKLNQNEAVKVSTQDSIRLGNKVDIDLSDFEDKFKAMKDGDSFYIGRTVKGPNDIKINNEYVSGTHLKVEKRNGEIYITDMSRNGTTLNTTQPDYAAKYSPEVQAKYDNARTGQDYYNIMEDNYSNLRNADYSYESSVRNNISDVDLMDTKNVDIRSNGYWFFRNPKGKTFVDSNNVVDRISLNVVADKNMLKELDELCASGTYINSKGERVQINQQNCTYKTPPSLEGWTERHDPITMYFDQEVSQEFQDALAEITAKYQRPSPNGKALMNSLEGKPWIAHESYIKPDDAKALYEEAKQLDSELANAIFHYLDGGGRWNCSTGQFAAAQKTLDEFKLANGGKARNVNMNANVITPEHRMAMGQISNNINRARTYQDLEKAQRWLNTIPDCQQKEILQKQLNAKFAQMNYQSA